MCLIPHVPNPSRQINHFKCHSQGSPCWKAITTFKIPANYVGACWYLYTLIDSGHVYRPITAACIFKGTQFLKGQAVANVIETHMAWLPSFHQGLNMMDQNNVFFFFNEQIVTYFNEWGSSISALSPICPSIWTLYCLAEFSPGKLSSLGCCTFSLTHIWTCYIWKLENESAFTEHAKSRSGKRQAHLSFSVKEIVQAASSGEKKPMNEKVSQVLIMYQGSRLKSQCFCSASEQLQCLSEFWLEKGRYTKICELHAKDMFL